VCVERERERKREKEREGRSEIYVVSDVVDVADGSAICFASPRRRTSRSEVRVKFGVCVPLTRRTLERAHERVVMQGRVDVTTTGMAVAFVVDIVVVVVVVDDGEVVRNIDLLLVLVDSSVVVLVVVVLVVVVLVVVVLVVVVDNRRVVLVRHGAPKKRAVKSLLG